MKVDIRHHRLNVAGMSIEAFAKRVGVTPDVIRNLEVTGNRPRPKNAVKVARHFGFTPDEMWCDEGEASADTSATPKRVVSKRAAA